MNHERHNQLFDLVGRARELPAERWQSFLSAECAGDPELARMALEILAEDSGEFDKPLVSLQSDLRPGDVLVGKYLITATLGRGGQGRVYQAEDLTADRQLAVKQMLGHDAFAQKLFEREYRMLRKLARRTPKDLAGSLPSVADFFTDAGGLYFAMEFIPGRSLDELLAESDGPLPVERVVDWGDRLLRLLDFLHTHAKEPIIHRDIKPQNLKLTPEGRLVLLDFGLTKGAIEEFTKLGRAATSVFAQGTKQYAPWEQLAEGTGEERSDLFSLAATLYALLTKTTFPDVYMRQKTLAAGSPDPLRPANELNADVPLSVAAVLERAMRLLPEDRFATAREMREALLGMTQAEEVDEEKTLERAASGKGPQLQPVLGPHGTLVEPVRHGAGGGAAGGVRAQDPTPVPPAATLVEGADVPPVADRRGRVEAALEAICGGQSRETVALELARTGLSVEEAEASAAEASERFLELHRLAIGVGKSGREQTLAAMKDLGASTEVAERILSEVARAKSQAEGSKALGFGALAATISVVSWLFGWQVAWVFVALAVLALVVGFLQYFSPTDRT